MQLRLTRLAPGDWLIGGAALALLVVLFAFPWFAVRGNFAAQVAAGGGTVSANGWSTFTAIGPLTAIVGVLGVAAWLFQATRRAPALAILTTIVLAPFSLLLLLWLIARVLIFPPHQYMAVGATGNDLVGKPAAYVAVVLSLIVVIGVWTSLRREGIDPADAPQAVETFTLPGQ